MVFRKILKNKWLISCFLIGLLITVALISSIPLYTEGILQRLLVKELEGSQEKTNKYPGLYQTFFVNDDMDLADVFADIRDNDGKIFENEEVLDYYENRLGQFKKIQSYVHNDVPKRIRLPIKNYAEYYAINARLMVAEDNGPISRKNKTLYTRLESISDLSKHVKLIDGRLPEKEPVNGVYEVLVSEWGLQNMNITKDRVFVLNSDKDSGLEPIKVKPVGVFTVEQGSDPFWGYTSFQYTFKESFLIDESVMKKDFIEKQPTLIYMARWTYAFDYNAMNINNLKGIVGGHARIVKDLKSIYKGSSIDTPFMYVIESYFDKENKLKNMLWVLNVPVIIMLLLYLYMVSGLIIQREKNEISLLASRGASRIQVVTGYVIEGLIIGSIALAAGPWLGLALSKVLGASSGFLELAKRKALLIHMNRNVFLYAVLAAVVALFTLFIPAYIASKTSIVDHKRNMSRKNPHALWSKLFIDVIFISLAVYGYYSFSQRQKMMQVTSVSALDIQIDPLLFIVPTLFIIGTGLLFLRLYPWLIKGIYWLGRRIWPPAMYITLTQIGRSFNGYHFLVVFLVMTLSTGLFSATSARTINRNTEEKIHYNVGSDMVIEELWENDAPRGGSAGGMGAAQAAGSDADVVAKPTRINYEEPSFLRFSKIEGVENTAKVFTKDNAFVEMSGKYAENVNLMGIDPYDFGNVAWFRNGLLPHHINEYLNILASEPSGCLISKSISETYGIRTGDVINMGWQGNNSAVFNVYGIIDYWPSWNPNKDPLRTEEGEPMLMVVNLQYIQDHLGTEPYSVWLKLKPEATSKQVYESMEKNKIHALSIKDASQQVIQERNSPFQLAINGVLSLGFIISGIICFLGFLIFWILSINSRTLQFGIFRAMGLTTSNLVSMIVWEQLMTSGAAILSGIFIGIFSSRIFVPFFQITFDAYSQVPPFKVISYWDDRLKIYVFLGFTLLLGLTILGFLISHIKINQAIKLGEE